MNSVKPSSPLVSIAWLKENLGHPDLIILDASLPKPKTSPADNPLANVQIPGTRFLDIDNIFSDTSGDLPHTMLSEKEFSREAQKLGISKTSTIIVYDNLGVYSSPRVWWMFRSMGHENITVLDGGLPEWVAAGLQTEPKQSTPCRKGDFIAKYQADFFKNSSDVLSSINDSDFLVLDARSSGRFLGTEPEPRAGLRGGHIPNSINLHFEDVTKDHKILPPSDLKKQFKQLGISNQHLTFTCGSGLTACIIALAADLAGFENTSVYDGSWSEWGRPGDLPVS